MKNSIDPRAPSPSPTKPPQSKKRKRSLSVDNHGVATPPKSPRFTPIVPGQGLKNTEHSLIPTPPSSIQASPEPSVSPEVITTILAFIRDLKDGKTPSQYETSFSIPADEFESFELALEKDKALSRYCKKKLRYEWDSINRVFTILEPDTETEKTRSRITQSLQERLRELADSEYTLGGLDSWEGKRAKELADLVRPLRLRKLDIGQSRMSPDLCFTFGIPESLLALAQRRVEPLVVFEVRCVESLIGKDDMERRARIYLDVSGQKCSFRHRVKTVVLVHHTHERREAQLMVTRLGQEAGKGITTTNFVNWTHRDSSENILLSLSDFLPQDAIELGFMQDTTGRRACDGIKIGIEIS
ncbi:hypothetical protein E2P81_ATG11032 [Venturia nashicola]|uniref:Uncharacterized protein n=1 Tax=Venturia nashicola TaxID=86259 RepID=A0A4Z1P7R0_9PEZI|nr:hypothetical protein E6O75_ATG10708 [Venturia nashicola]TLD27744.1 hypothetical protein E2P81_ATG11032 [Venturia nashicola]